MREQNDASPMMIGFVLVVAAILLAPIIAIYRFVFYLLLRYLAKTIWACVPHEYQSKIYLWYAKLLYELNKQKWVSKKEPAITKYRFLILAETLSTGKRCEFDCDYSSDPSISVKYNDNTLMVCGRSGKIKRKNSVEGLSSEEEIECQLICKRIASETI